MIHLLNFCCRTPVMRSLDRLWTHIHWKFHGWVSGWLALEIPWLNIWSLKKHAWTSMKLFWPQKGTVFYGWPKLVLIPPKRFFFSFDNCFVMHWLRSGNVYDYLISLVPNITRKVSDLNPRIWVEQFSPVKLGHGIMLSLKQGVFWQSLSLRSEFAKIRLKLLWTTLTNGQLAISKGWKGT